MQTGVNWFSVYPQGMEEMLMYATQRYKNIPLYVTENGKHVAPQAASLRFLPQFLISSFLQVLARTIPEYC